MTLQETANLILAARWRGDWIEYNRLITTLVIDKVETLDRSDSDENVRSNVSDRVCYGHRP